MTRALLTLALTAAFSGNLLARDLELVESAYELSLGDIVMPGSTAGSAIFRTCEDCDTVSLRVNAGTRYYIGGQALALPDFILAVDEIRKRSGGNEATAVGVFYDLATKQVTHIDVQAQRR
jgi:hypothetical protein